MQGVGSEGVNKEDGGAVGRSDLDRRPTPVCLVRVPVEGAEPVWLCRVAAAAAGGVHVSWWWTAEQSRGTSRTLSGRTAGMRSSKTVIDLDVVLVSKKAWPWLWRSMQLALDLVLRLEAA